MPHDVPVELRAGDHDRVGDGGVRVAARDPERDREPLPQQRVRRHEHRLADHRPDLRALRRPRGRQRARGAQHAEADRPRRPHLAAPSSAQRRPLRARRLRSWTSMQARLDSRGSRSWRSGGGSAGSTSGCRRARSRCGGRRGPACRTACRGPRCSRCTRGSTGSSRRRGSDPSLAQLWGPRYNTYVVAKRDFALFSLGRLPDDAQGPAAGRAHGRAAARPSRRQADDRPRGRRARSASATRSGTPRRRARSRSAGRARGRRSSGRVAAAGDRPGRRVPRARSTLPPRLRADHGRRVRPLGGHLAARRRPTRSRRSRDRCCRSGRRSATSGCSRRTRPAMRAAETAAAPARLLPSGDAYFLLDGAERELLVPRADQRQRLWTSRVWPGALLVDGEIRGTWRRAQHTVRVDAWARLSRASARRGRGRGRRPAASGSRPADRGGLGHLSRSAPGSSLGAA